MTKTEFISKQALKIDKLEQQNEQLRRDIAAAGGILTETTPTLYFSELEVGERFTWGGEEHIKIMELRPDNIGIVNNICLATDSRSGQVSGMGSKVRVNRK